MCVAKSKENLVNSIVVLDTVNLSFVASVSGKSGSRNGKLEFTQDINDAQTFASEFEACKAIPASGDGRLMFVKIVGLD